ncbi:MAG: hypothetical protein OXI49_18155 [Acidobacteriota bacterium]|nr:hypothetical protein [Acidobacteriota bacterium]
MPTIILAVLLLGCGGTGYDESTAELAPGDDWLIVRVAGCSYIGYAMMTEPWTARVDYQRSFEIIGHFNSGDEAIIAAKNAVLERCNNPE